jgi:magnesium transporter
MNKKKRSFSFVKKLDDLFTKEKNTKGKNKVKLDSDQKEEIEDTLFDFYYDEQGLTPGTIEIEKDAPITQLELIDFTKEKVVYLTPLNATECERYLDSDSTSWVDVSGLGSEHILKDVGRVFKLHPLVLEDVINVPQRPKIEEYNDQLLVIMQMVMNKKDDQGFWLEQVSFILGKNYLLTVQEEPNYDCFDNVRERIHKNKGTIRSQKADYLAYALWDAVIDGYFPVLEAYGERIDDLEDQVVLSPNNNTLQQIYTIKRELLALRRAIWPQRDALNSLLRDHSNLISKNVRVYLKDCYDHIVQIIDIIEIYRELASGLMDVYLSSVSNKMNEIMKFLTVVSSIFIPLTFIAGVYGMNFKTEISPLNMPELNWYWGYPFFWLLIIVLVVSLIFFFWKKGWFENMSSIKID